MNELFDEVLNETLKEKKQEQMETAKERRNDMLDKKYIEDLINMECLNNENFNGKQMILPSIIGIYVISMIRKGKRIAFTYENNILKIKEF